MIVEVVDPWEESEISKAFKQLQSDIDNQNLIQDNCRCDTPGQDDGNQTCWRHHDCRDGYCTHQDGGENV